MNRNVAFAISLVNSQSDISGRYTRVMDRKDAMKRLIDERFGGKQADFARAINRSPSLVWQCLNGHRNIGEKLAREIESKLRLPRGWMDMIILDEAHRGDMHSAEVEHAIEQINAGPPAKIPEEFETLISKASPRSYKQLMRIAEAAAEGRLSEADINLLNEIAERIAAKE